MCFKGVVGGSFLEDIWGLARLRGSRSDRAVTELENWKEATEMVI
jgi:hypothetical protein